MCSPFLRLCCLSSTAIPQQKYCTIEVLFSEVTRELSINQVPTLDLVFPRLLCFCCYFLIIAPSRHCLPIETVAKWVENSVRFCISSGYCRHYQLIKTTNSKGTNKTFSLTLRYPYLIMTVVQKAEMQTKTPQCANLLFLNNMHKCSRKYCCIIYCFITDMDIICLKEFKCPSISQ